MNRPPSSIAASALVALAAFGVTACTDAEPPIQRYYDAYEGDVYPNQRPKLVIPPGGMGIVSDSRSDTLSLIDLATGERFATYPVGREPVTIDGPHHVAADPARGFVFTALSYPAVAGAAGPHAAHGSSIVSGYAQKLAMDDMRVLGQVRVDPNPGEIVLSEDGKRLVVSHYDLQRALNNPGNLEKARSTLVVIDPDSMALSGSPEPLRIPLCIAGHGAALSKPDGARAYVACYGEDALAVVDLTDPSAEVTRVDLGGDATIGSPAYGPYAVVMSPDGKTLAVSSTVSKDVRFFDVDTGAFDLSRTLKTQGAPFFVAWSADGTRLFVPTQQPDAIALIDLAQGNTEIAYRDLGGECDKPHVVERASDAILFLVCEGDQTSPGDVLMLDATTLETKGATKVGAFPDAFVRVAGGVTP